MRRPHHPRAGRGRADGGPHRDPLRGPRHAGGHAGAPHRAPGPGGAAPPAITFGAPPALDVVALAAAVGPTAVVTEAAPGRYRVEAADVATPAVTAAVANFLAARGATLTDLVAGKTLEDVYFETVGRRVRDHHGRDTGRRGRDGAGAGREAGPVSTATGTLRPLTAQTGAEIYMTLRRGETLLLTLGIPVVFLLFFSKVSRGRRPRRRTPANFFVPGILALAVMSTAMVSLGIATGFERGYGVLKRLGATPLGRPRLLGAKIATIVAIELAAGRRPAPGRARPGLEPRWQRHRPRSPARSAPCSWAQPPSPASASSWPARCGPRSTWPRPTAFISSCCCWAA